MSKKSSKKKIVTTNKGDQKQGKVVVPKKKTVAPTVSKTKATHSGDHSINKKRLVFGRENYIWMGIGAGLVALGMLLMVGGAQPDPNTWDPDIIYSKRITVLGPFVILAGLAVEIFAIFKQKLY